MIASSTDIQGRGASAAPVNNALRSAGARRPGVVAKRIIDMALDMFASYAHISWPISQAPGSSVSYQQLRIEIPYCCIFVADTAQIGLPVTVFSLFAAVIPLFLPLR